MTRRDFQTLTNASNVLERISEKDVNNEKLGFGYKQALRESADHYSMLMYQLEKTPGEQLFDHPFYNDELAAVVNDDQFIKSKEVKYEVDIDPAGTEWNLSIFKVDDIAEPDDLCGIYNNYLTVEEAQNDIAELQKLGYQLIKINA